MTLRKLARMENGQFYLGLLRVYEKGNNYFLKGIAKKSTMALPM